jgi:60 kDa SS-A/Ro ribonucleoprotein
MGKTYAKHFSTRATPQSTPIPGSPMVPNSAGGFSFAVDDWKRLDRFLILGNEGGSYYASEKALTIENAKCVTKCLNEDAARTVNQIVAISDSGRAPRNDPAIFALAIACGHAKPEARRLAEAAIPKVCRIGTHLFQFVEAVKGFRGWGAGLRSAVSRWYTDKSADALAYQVAKYRQRNGMSHRDVLRMAHPQLDDRGVHAAIARWITAEGELGERVVKRGDRESAYAALLSRELPAFLCAVDEAKTSDRKRLAKLIIQHDLPRECVPTEALGDIEIWAALLVKMPMTAMVRNLGKMTSIGLLKPGSSHTKLVCEKLADREYIRKSRLHPLAVLVAARTYGSGHGDKGKLTWQPVSRINDVLDAAFYMAFDNVEPTNKRIMLALDVSGSMTSTISGTSITNREAAACLALVAARTEPEHTIVAFTAVGGRSAWGSFGGMHGGGDPELTPLDISSCSRLTDVVERTSNLPFGGTDCSIPMRWALKNKVAIDAFQVYTDSETWAGPVHPSQALVEYRQKMNIPAKSAVVAFESNGFSIADPRDAGMMDCVGFDTALPAVLGDFLRG